MPRLKSDLVDLLEGIADKTLALKKIEIDPRASATVMCVSGGYPGSYEKGKPISGLDEAEAEGCILFHAGTRSLGEGTTVTSGGRVIACSAYGDNIVEAVDKALDGASKIDFDGKYFRHDIGFEFRS